MSFMYDPIPYDENSALNIIHDLSDEKVLTDIETICDELIIAWKDNEIIALDGYLSANFERIVEILKAKDNSIKFISTRAYMKDKLEIDRMLEKYLPHDPVKDPYDMFGKLYPDNIESFFREEKVELKTDSKICLYGFGSSSDVFKEQVSKVVYIDLTPKDAVLRAQSQNYETIGDFQKGNFKDLMRRYYYIDIEVAIRHRKKLIQNSRIDYYVLETWQEKWMMMTFDILGRIFKHLSTQPFRTKPIYLDGVWGGHYIRRIRKVPEEIAPRIAWSFEFIPLEASILVKHKETLIDIPFYTFLNACENEILGSEVNKKFQGNFPVRFNYDDTWHSSGNMSIQCHPNKNYALENYNEYNSQDEAYYVVTVGHDARTYCGFKDKSESFLEDCRNAFDTRTELDYQSYIHAEKSFNGLQVFIPAGTVHGSGRNQVVLELGSFTVGAYTYKMYDYNRKDINGTYRPIHLENAKEVLDITRDEEWIKHNSVIEPILLKEKDDYSEFIIGKNSYMYYETHQINLNHDGIYSDSNNDEFTVLTLCDGEEVEIFDLNNSNRRYNAKYLDVIVVPSTIKNYGVKVISDHPVVLHKTILKREGGE